MVQSSSVAALTCVPPVTFPLTMGIKVSWVTTDQYLESTETEIDADL